MPYLAVPALPDEDAAVTGAKQMGFLHLVHIQVAAVAGKDLHYLIGQEVCRIYSLIRNDDICLSALLHYDKDTTVDHSILLTLQHITYLYGVLHFSVTRHIYDQRIHTKQRIQGHNSILLVGQLVIIGSYIYGSLADTVAEWKFLQLQGSKTNAVVRSKVGRHIGVLIAFHFTSGELQSLKSLQGSLTLCIHHPTGTLVNELVHLSIEIDILLC